MAETGDNAAPHPEGGESFMGKIAETLHLSKGHDQEKHEEVKHEEEHKHEAEKHDDSSSSSSSSDSESEKPKATSSPSAVSAAKAKIYRLFGREKPVHQVLGGGKPADVFLWRNKKISATVLGAATAIWILFELLGYHLLTLVCHLLIFSLSVLFLWANASTFISKTAPPRIPEVSLPEKPILEVIGALRFELNRGLKLLHDVATGKDLKKFLAVVAGLWLLSIVGKSCDFLTLFYINFVLLHTVPVLYEKYEDKVDAFVEKAMGEAKKHYGVVNEKYISKIPRGPLKNKKAD